MFSLTSLWLLLTLGLNHHPFSCPSGHFTMEQMYRLKIITSFFFFTQAYGTEANYCPTLDLSADNLSDQGCIPRIQNKGYSFRLMGRDVIENKTEVSDSYTDWLEISTSVLPSTWTCTHMHTYTSTKWVYHKLPKTKDKEKNLQKTHSPKCNSEEHFFFHIIKICFVNRYISIIDIRYISVTVNMLVHIYP